MDDVPEGLYRALELEVLLPHSAEEAVDAVMRAPPVLHQLTAEGLHHRSEAGHSMTGVEGLLSRLGDLPLGRQDLLIEPLVPLVDIEADIISLGTALLLPLAEGDAESLNSYVSPTISVYRA